MKPAPDPETLRQKLKLKHLYTKKDFLSRHKEADDYLKKQGIDLSSIREYSAKLISAGALAGTLALSAPNSALALLPPPNEIIEKARANTAPMPAVSRATRLREALRAVLPEGIRPLHVQEEKYIERIISELTGIPVRATLEGEHLNTTYGKIGLEQHLRRYPGDKLKNHGQGEALREGMAPGLGAWGYFAKNSDELTADLVETEKWYAVVQTLYLPDWNTRQPYLKDWYKYRKVMIVNTETAKAVVAGIADSGPAAFTGKQFGGSPEVMDYLGGANYTKGTVILFFVDDPENKIPLGPVEYNEV